MQATQVRQVRQRLRWAWGVWLVCALAAVATGASARAAAVAELWCAANVEAHEWGVMAFDAHGASLHGLVPLPSWFYQRASAPSEPALGGLPGVSPVRSLPPDSGDRDLPVLQLYSKGQWGPVVPLGLEVGFTSGVATAWFPQVDGLRSAAEANSPGAAAARAQLLAQRAARAPFSPGVEPLPSDPTRQLIWEALELSQAAPAAAPHPPELPWVQALREVPDALWVRRGGDVERFIFYEGRVSERPMLSVAPPAGAAAGACACEVTNGDSYPLHDVLLVWRSAHGVRVGFVDVVAAGARAQVELSPPLSAEGLEAATTARLITRLTADPAAGGEDRDGRDGPALCNGGRDPAIPTEASSGHTLYPAEAQALLSAWGPHLFAQPDLTTVYREDPARLDAVMPLSLYTDMHHAVRLHRVGLVTQRGLPLSACACSL